MHTFWANVVRGRLFVKSLITGAFVKWGRNVLNCLENFLKRYKGRILAVDFPKNVQDSGVTNASGISDSLKFTRSM